MISRVECKTKQPGTFQYYMDRMYYVLSGTLNIVIDGAPTTQSFSTIRAKPYYRNTFVEGADCLADAKTIDKATVDEAFRYVYGKDAVFTYTLSGCKITRVNREVLGRAIEGSHPCESINVANPSPGIPGTCSDTEEPSSTWAHTKSTFMGYYVPDDTQAHATGSVPIAIYNLIKKQFNTGNFIFSMVINPSSGTCALTTGASYGTRYEELINMTGATGQVVPICASDYSAKILDISKQLGTLGMNDFTLSPGLGARVSGVDVVRGSNIITATEGADFTRTGDVIVFRSGFLQTTDIVRFYLK